MVHPLARRPVWAMWGNTAGVRKKKRPARAHIGIRSPHMVHEVVDVLSHSQSCPEAWHYMVRNVYCWSIPLTNTVSHLIPH